MYNNGHYTIKDNRYFVPSFNFNNLKDNVIIIDRINKRINIPKQLVKNDSYLKIIDQLKPIYEKACNFTPPKN